MHAVKTGAIWAAVPRARSTVLAAIWGVPVQRVTDRRPKGHRAKWYQRNAAHVRDPTYLAAVVLERKRPQAR